LGSQRITKPQLHFLEINLLSLKPGGRFES
jgi:hypothetical protein